MKKRKLFAFIVTLVLLCALSVGALAAYNSQIHGSNYDHIDVKMPSHYTVNIDGVPVTLTGHVKSGSITVHIGNTDYDMGTGSRSEDGSYDEYNLSFGRNRGFSAETINWTSNSAYTMENVFITATVEFSIADHAHLTTAQKLALGSVFEISSDNSKWIYRMTKVKYTGVQECTGGNGMRSNGYTGKPNGLDLYFTAEDMANLITTGVMSIQKTVVDDNGFDDLSDTAVFDFTLELWDASSQAYKNVQLSYNSDDKQWHYVSADDSKNATEVSVTANSTTTMTGLPVGQYRVTEMIRDDYVILGADGTPSGNYSKNYTVVTKTDEEIPVLNFVNHKLNHNERLFSMTKAHECAPDAPAHTHTDPIITITGVTDPSFRYTGTVGSDPVYFNLPVGKYIISESGSPDDYQLTITPDGGLTFTPVYTQDGKFTNTYEFEVTDSTPTGVIALSLLNTYEKVVEDKPIALLTLRKTWDVRSLTEEEHEELENNLKFTVTGSDGFNQEIPYSSFFNGEYVLSSEDGIKEGVTYTVTESGADLDNVIHVAYAYVNGAFVENDQTDDHVTSVQIKLEDKAGDNTNNYVGEVAWQNLYYKVGQLIVKKQFAGDLTESQFPADQEITITLNSTTVADFETKTATLGKGVWSYAFTNLLPGTYTVTETDGQNVTDYEVTVSGDGDYSVKAGETTTAVITNTYEADHGHITVKKIFSADSAIHADHFTGTIQIHLAGENVDQTVTLNSANSWQHTFINLDPGTYTVTELLDGAKIENHNLSVSVTVDDEDPVINNSADMTVESNETHVVTFANTYDGVPGTLTVTKAFAGDLTGADVENALEGITIYVDCDANSYHNVITLTEETDWTWHSGALEPGDYVITEKDAPIAGYTWSVKGETTATVTYNSSETVIITNTYLANPGSITVEKTFGADSALNAETFDGSITIQLMQDGNLLDEATLTKGNWTHTFENLEPGIYDVVEIDAEREGYTLTAVADFDQALVIAGQETFVGFENTYQSEEKVEELPQTGDNSRLMLWLSLLAVSAAGLLLVIKRRTASAR